MVRTTQYCPVFARLRRSATLNLFAGAALLSMAATGTAGILGFHPLIFTAKALGFYLVLVAIVFRFLGAHLPLTVFGLPNRLTLARGLLVCLIGASIGEDLPAAAAWWILGAGALALALDGCDGYAARRWRQASAFGARFDMELDALFILILAVTAWQSGKAGAWILLAGLARYLFVAAAWVWPQLKRPLPPSQRRRAVCALLAGGLMLCLAPFVTEGVGVGTAALALAAVTASFAIDLGYLVRAQASVPNPQFASLVDPGPSELRIRKDTS
jgi:phosphatidylglycerophosphate synthase